MGNGSHGKRSSAREGGNGTDTKRTAKTDQGGAIAGKVDKAAAGHEDKCTEGGIRAETAEVVAIHAINHWRM